MANGYISIYSPYKLISNTKIPTLFMSLLELKYTLSYFTYITGPSRYQLGVF